MEKKGQRNIDIRKAFASLSNEIKSGTAEEQLGSVGEMLTIVSNYLHQNIQDIDTSIILVLLEELNNISNGNEPKFIKPRVLGGGRPLDAGKNIQQASLCAAIQILINNGEKVKEAVDKVSKISKWQSKKLLTLRADFSKGNKSRDATDYMWHLIKIQKIHGLDPNLQAKALVEIALKIGE